MKLKKLMKNNRLLFRLIISYLITSVLLTAVLMAVVTGFVTNRFTSETTEASSNQLKQAYTTLYYALTDIYGDNYDLWTRDDLIRKALSTEEISQEETKMIISNLNRKIVRHELVESVYLVNKVSNTIISHVSSYEWSNFYDQDALRLFNEYEVNYDTYLNETFFPRSNDESGNSSNLISIVYARKDDGGSLNSGLIVNINQGSLSKLVTTNNNSTELIIVNSMGKIISGSKGFGEVLPRDEFYYSIANNENVEDSFTGYYFGEKSFVSFKKAMDLGFVFISITPYSSLLSEVIQVDFAIGLFFILSIIISILVSTYSAKKIYEPLNNLIKKMKENPSIELVSGDEYTFLDEAYKNLILKNKSSQISRILNGTYGDSSLEVLGFKDDHKFLVFSLIPDDGQELTVSTMEKLLELINSNNNMQGSFTAPDCISCIIQDVDFSESKMEEIMESLVNLQRMIAENLDIVVSVGLGTVVNNLESIKFSQRYSLQAVQNALKSGDGQILFYTDIENSKVAASLNKENIAEKIQDYIDKNFTRQDFSVDEINDELDLSLSYVRQIFKSEKGITLNDYIINCRIEMAKQLLTSTEKTAKEISEEVGYYDNRYFYTIFKKKVGMTTDEYRKSISSEEALWFSGL